MFVQQLFISLSFKKRLHLLLFPHCYINKKNSLINFTSSNSQKSAAQWTYNLPVHLNRSQISEFINRTYLTLTGMLVCRRSRRWRAAAGSGAPPATAPGGAAGQQQKTMTVEGGSDRGAAAASTGRNTEQTGELGAKLSSSGGGSNRRDRGR